MSQNNPSNSPSLEKTENYLDLNETEEAESSEELGQTYHYVVSEEESGQRLDRFLVKQDDLECTRSYIKKLIEEEEVRFNNLLIKKPSTKLREHDTVSVHVPPPKVLETFPQDIPIEVLYEDSHLIVVNKAAGMTVHPSIGHYDGTLVNALLYHCTDLSGIGGTLRPGIVHRLDKDTSGALVVAKSDLAHQGLKTLFQERPFDRLNRRYHAWVQGPFKEDAGVIETNYGRHPVHRKRFSSRHRGSRRAMTHYKILGRYGKLTHLELRLETGRTHQIRVHLSDRQRPLIGDKLYPPSFSRQTSKVVSELPRQALHAVTLEFEHPITKEMISCNAPLPEDLRLLHEWLQKSNKS